MATTATGAGATGASVGGFFRKAFNGAKDWGNKAFPNAKASFKNFAGSTGAFAPEGFDYTFNNGLTGSGLKAFGKNVGGIANIANIGVQGVDALKGISEYSDSKESNEDLMRDIRTSAMGNPLLSSYLTSDQMNLLDKVKRGNYDNSSDIEDFLSGAIGGVGDAAMGALSGGLFGGLPGAIIGGVGGLINSGIDGLTSANSANSAELAALYQALTDAEMQYKAMRRPTFTGLGIQQRYQDMYS